MSATPRWVIDVIGPTKIRDANHAVVELRPKERAVVAALALAHPDPLSTRQVIDLVWPPPAPSTARKSLNNHVARIRSVADGLIVTVDGGYQLGNEVVIDDVSCGDGIGLAYADLPDGEAVEARRLHVDARQSARREDELAAELRSGATPALLGRLTEAVEIEPYSERRWQLLAEAQLRLERRRDAMATLRSARRTLSGVGLEPGPLITRLEADVLEGRCTPTHTTTDPRPPFHPHRCLLYTSPSPRD